MDVMAGCTYIQVLRLTVITEILLLCVAQNTHRQNVARGKMCDISSTWTNRDTCLAAINGDNTNLNYPINCIHTAGSDKLPFWWVDLGNEFTINTMTIYGRTGFIDKMTQVNIFLDKNIVKSFTSQDTWTNDKYVITVGRVGRVVNITKDKNTGSTMNICEVEVWVCEDGWYGDCTQACTYCPRGSVCDKVDGSCTTCETGFQLPHCEVCRDGRYGDDCKETCGRCAGGDVCNKTNGRCTSCQTGFQLPLCKEPPMTTSSSVQAPATENPSFLSTGMSCDNDKETVSVAGPVAGAAVGCSVIFFIVGAIFAWWLKKSRSQQPLATGSTPYEIPTISDTGTSRSTSRPDEKVDSTSDYTNIGYTTNVYEALKAPDDNNTTAYTSLDFHTDVHR